jgi:hypothetical protein
MVWNWRASAADRCSGWPSPISPWGESQSRPLRDRCRPDPGAQCELGPDRRAVPPPRFDRGGRGGGRRSALLTLDVASDRFFQRIGSFNEPDSARSDVLYPVGAAEWIAQVILGPICHHMADGAT